MEKDGVVWAGEVKKCAKLRQSWAINVCKNFLMSCQKQPVNYRVYYVLSEKRANHR